MSQTLEHKNHDYQETSCCSARSFHRKLNEILSWPCQSLDIQKHIYPSALPFPTTPQASKFGSLKPQEHHRELDYFCIACHVSHPPLNALSLEYIMAFTLYSSLSLSSAEASDASESSSSLSLSLSSPSSNTLCTMTSRSKLSRSTWIMVS